MTAAVGLYLRLGLPEPWFATTTPTPLIVYGASGTVVSIIEQKPRMNQCLTILQRAYAIKLAQASNIHPIIAVAGRGQPFVEKLIDRSKGDAIVDY